MAEKAICLCNPGTRPLNNSIKILHQECPHYVHTCTGQWLPPSWPPDPQYWAHPGHAPLTRPLPQLGVWPDIIMASSLSHLRLVNSQFSTLAVSRGKVMMSAIQAAVPAVSSWALRLGGAWNNGICHLYRVKLMWSAQKYYGHYW